MASSKVAKFWKLARFKSYSRDKQNRFRGVPIQIIIIKAGALYHNNWIRSTVLTAVPLFFQRQHLIVSHNGG